MNRSLAPIMNIFLLVTLFLQGCSDNDHNGAGAANRSYEVTVINLTHHQPFSPVAAVMHNAGYQGMMLGRPASVGLENLAESGDNSTFLSEAQAHASVGNTASGTGVITPGTGGTVTLTGNGTLLTVTSMLVNTNDALVAVNDLELGKLSKGETMVLSARAYDAGTEGNSEAASDVPGPVAGGEGFNAARNDRNFVVVHPGIISMDDGLSTSALSEAHRFDNPVAKIIIKRIS